MNEPSNGKGWLIAGIILILIGLAYYASRPSPRYPVYSGGSRFPPANPGTGVPRTRTPAYPEVRPSGGGGAGGFIQVPCTVCVNGQRACNGTGSTFDHAVKGSPLRPCKTCHGSGHFPCGACQGRGWVRTGY